MSEQEVVNDVIDLRQKGVLSIELAKLASQIEAEVRDEYTSYVGELSCANKIAGVEWLVNVTCRNPYQTNILDNFCKIKLLDRCLQEQRNIKVVRVDGCDMLEAVDDLRSKYGAYFSIETNDKNIVWYHLFGLIRRSMILIYLSLISFFVPRLLCGKRIHPNHSIIYIDTFAKSSDFDDDGRFIDRYYPGMMDILEEDSVDRKWYSPVNYSYRTPFDLKRYIDRLKKSPGNFLIIEEWLKGSDYLHALVLSFLLPQRIVNIPRFRGIDVSSMIRSELMTDLFSTGIFGALLRYRFIQRLRQDDVKILKVIDWSENQVIDRALCLAIREFYPSVRIIGYQGYIVSEHYLSHEPACYERNAGTVPDIICVVHGALLERKKKYCTMQQVTIAPAFRFRQLMNYNSTGTEKRDFVLLALPVHKILSRFIVQLSLQVNERKKFRFLIKLHPSVSTDDFIADVPESRDSAFYFVQDSLYTLFPKTVLLISSDSSACFEAVYCGVRVVVIGNRSGPTSNPLNGIVGPEYWRICYDADCLLDMLEQENSIENSHAGSLMPVTQNNVIDFLAL